MEAHVWITQGHSYHYLPYYTHHVVSYNRQYTQNRGETTHTCALAWDEKP